VLTEHNQSAIRNYLLQLAICFADSRYLYLYDDGYCGWDDGDGGDDDDVGDVVAVVQHV
jgi:hypothetical protein